MHYSHFVVLLAAQSVAATSHKLRPNPHLGVIGDLIGRQDIGSCTTSSTCSECFGEGNIICDYIGCFNPADYEQCCAGAAICIGKDNSCCKDLGGPGVVGKDGVPKTTLPSSVPVPTTTSFTCTADDSNEDCCQRGGKDLHWCTGKYPHQRCYNSKSQFCCTDGTVCDEKDCCSLFSASVTNPFTASAATNPPTMSQTGTTSGGAPQSTTAKDAGAVADISLRAVGVIGSGLGLALLL